MTDTIIEKSKLSLDFEKFPYTISRNGIKKENVPTKADVFYLYIELNLNYEEMAKIFHCSYMDVFRLNKKYKIKKNKELVQACRERTNIEKYGFKSPMQTKDGRAKMRGKRSEETKNKMSLIVKQRWDCTKKERLEKVRQTRLLHYGDENFNNREKAKETIKELYGVGNAMALGQFKEKMCETIKERYGVDNVSKSEKIKQKKEQTCLQNYGVKYPGQSEELKQKIKETSIKRYGVTSYLGSKLNRKFLMENKQEIDKKRHDTQKRNKTFNVSKQEEQVFSGLKDKFPDVKRQYSNQHYPFACDFYIPSLDLFIEYQGSWTHGGHPYNPDSIEDRKKVELWKQKAEEINFAGKKKIYYLNALYTWTNLDTRKRETANKNKLNWIEFFNFKELEQWLEKQ